MLVTSISDPDLIYKNIFVATGIFFYQIQFRSGSGLFQQVGPESGRNGPYSPTVILSQCWGFGRFCPIWIRILARINFVQTFSNKKFLA
jgi:hypothetical protein